MTRVATEDVEAFIAVEAHNARVDFYARPFFGRIEPIWEELYDDRDIPEGEGEGYWPIDDGQYKAIVREILLHASEAWSEAAGIPYVIEDRVTDITTDAVRKVMGWAE